MPSEQLRELSELSAELLKLLLREAPGGRLRRGLQRRAQLGGRLLASARAAARACAELGAAEETVARALLQREAERRAALRRLHELQGEREHAAARSPGLRQRARELHEELQELREQSRRLQEDGEDEGAAVPPDAYLTQLYYTISRIDWDYEAEPTRVKGIHYGPDIAQPIDLDGSQHSRCFLSDFLWSLVPTAW